MTEGQNKKVVTRFAPSPTGFMHIGGVRTALYAWLWARKNNGTFILRIEDTDKEREVPGSIEHIQESLKWLGLEWDLGPDKPEGGPYIQSERLDIYKAYALKLLEAGHAYPDPFTEDEVDQLRAKAEAQKKPFLYREYRKESSEAWDGKRALRFKVPEIKKYTWHDEVHGELSAGVEALDDFVILKADGYPTYNFAHIVDDIEMGVTHVMRGEEFISSTPKFLSLYEALGEVPPVFVTLPVILGPDGKKKLSKRDGAKDLMDYRKEGYLPDAMINFLALMGWNPGTDQEIFTREELISAFDITRIQKAGAQANPVKLEWINKEHIKKLEFEEVEKNILEMLPENMQKREVAELLRERISKWSDVRMILDSGELDFMNGVVDYTKKDLLFKDVVEKQITANLEDAIALIDKLGESEYTLENIKNSWMSLANSRPSRGEVLHPIRFALTGKQKSPDPFIIAKILGKNETLARLKKAVS